MHLPSMTSLAGLSIGSLLSKQSIFELLRLLVIGNFLQSKEVLSGFLIKLLLDIVYGEIDTGDDDEFEGIHTAICDFDDLVKGNELGLQGRDLDQVLKELLETITALLDSLTTTGETQH